MLNPKYPADIGINHLSGKVQRMCIEVESKAVPGLL